MALSVLYFASLREQMGGASQRVDCIEGESIAALAKRLASSRPDGGAALLEPSVRAARNQQLADRTELLCDGDEVAFFPPVTGG
ncbi:MAG: MoaD/ThiS family protein [Gammaproteobacteria bacterium]|nr:MoaD/ThiS family protein [Gammaproteobacteria bacterium]NND39946.1 MoaD/ThiS family protein [Pseudomonadales bacterium]MBT8152149.1 MoaD/ThiS family protein [Gammaproteobacteria bacterium]NNL10525.1 MoaD/ThiS family protein [Pseudomonadales bacterium]NNM10653.1 MoaD/ThiS family protein [Pseudomonadales bacterium]